MTRRSEFRRVFSEGIRVRGTITVVSRECESKATHVAFVAPRSVGSAVRRNKAKRRMREAMRQIDAPEGKDYILIASQAVLDAPFSELVEGLRAAVERQ